MSVLDGIARRRYTPGPTPLEPMDRLSEALGGPRIWVKRDDLLGLAAGGNKARKLEFLMADALAQGADGVVTCGAVQSNHCRMTLAAAIREGLECHLVIEERVPGSYHRDASGNNLLFHLLGATTITVLTDGRPVDAEMERLRAEAADGGRTLYVIPGGGSNALGALGYVGCAEELLVQAGEAGLAVSAVVCASGSGGTHAGLLAGLVPAGGPPVLGVSVRFDRATQEGRISRLAAATLERLALNPELPNDAVEVDDRSVGPGYSIPTDEMVDAIRLVAR